ncbi:CoA-dependent NAD(P)H Sulfur Oxidoreductase [Halapricum desulfuricans]|uniref:CoA-dependent NAD(P)H Sulfur Oxidoreductase n=1 Tax=Halapricum desulfuricans TaxID=2841257 RepID=A0A897NKJ7_9EURY|nr:FAD-dependent oxidoreductase [Halapricum desulfuricans]QSG11965.1 CoA-dependent NAD(P)H Sulfur Oxidoreductase [Halapricum desulfuricans]
MSERVVIVGGNAGGASAAARLRRLEESLDIVVLEKGENVSIGTCGMPYYVGDAIEDIDDLLVQTPQSLETRFALDIRTGHEVIDVDPEEKTVAVAHDGDTETVAYDSLLLSPGAEPIVPPIDGLDEAENVHTLQSLSAAEAIRDRVEAEGTERAVVIGGGYIGLEATESLQEAGLSVSLVEMEDHVMQALDYEMAAQINNHLRDQGVDLYLNARAESIDAGDSTTVELADGTAIPADVIVLATGVTPRTELAEAAGLEIGDAGGIVVDDRLRTTEDDVYAIGDAIEVTDCVTGEPAHVPLAGPANKQGRIVANVIAGREDSQNCVLSTSIAKVFEKTVAATGRNERALEAAGIDYEKSFTYSMSHASYYPGAEPMWIKLIFGPEDGRLYGAQIVGGEGVDKRIDVIATAIEFEKTVFDLQELDLAYAPPYGSGKDPVNMAGFAAGNIVSGVVDVLHWHDLEDLDPTEYTLLDCRPLEERHDDGEIYGTRKLPLSNIRDRLDELPEDTTIVPHCKAGLRSYITTRILTQHGFDAKNIAGGYELYRAAQRDRDARDRGAELGTVFR